MSVLTGPAILAAIADRTIAYDRVDGRWEEDPDQLVGPNSLDLHLGPRMLRYARAPWYRRWCGAAVRMVLGGAGPAMDLRRHRDWPTDDLDLDRYGGWVLEPGRLYLGCTYEVVGTTPGSGLVPYLDGRSSLARLGVAAHLAAGRGDQGFVGRWTVELVAFERVRLRPEDRLFQMTFVQSVGPERAYRPGRYGGRLGPQISRFVGDGEG